MKRDKAGRVGGAESEDMHACKLLEKQRKAQGLMRRDKALKREKSGLMSKPTLPHMDGKKRSRGMIHQVSW